MNCLVCHSDKIEKILDAPDVPVFTGIDQSVYASKSVVCVMFQCLDCSHVFQSKHRDVEEIMDEIYSTDFSCGSTSKGVGNFGESILNECVKNIELSPKVGASILEIGSSDGHMLSHFKRIGFSDITGIDPCYSKTLSKEGITYVAGKVHKALDLNRKFDYIFTSDVLEHVFDCQSFISFCAKHLSAHGQLILTVPNCERLLSTGDPACFMHQHIHSFTSFSIRALLQKYGFKIDKSNTTKADHYLKCSFGPSDKIDSELKLYLEYGSKLKNLVKQLEKKIKTTSGRIIFHGVNNTLNNVLSWLPACTFELAENDLMKIGTKWFGNEVNSVESYKLCSDDLVVVIPSTYEDDIVSGWRKMGSRFKIYSLINGEILF